MSETRAPYVTQRIATPESAVQKAVIDLLIWQYKALIIRTNSGALTPDQQGANGGRFVPFNYWAVLGQDRQTKGVSDVLALLPPPSGYILEQGTIGLLLAIECKSPDRRNAKGQPAQPSPDQARFLAAVAERGGLALVCDDVNMLIAELEKRGY